MKISSLTLSILLGSSILYSCSSSKSSSSGAADLLATLQLDEPIDGVCDNERVIAILPFPGNGQVEAVAPISDEEIEAKLNSSVQFLKDNPEYNDKGMVGLIVNCEGEMVRCQIDNKTQSPELDEQIVAVFAQMKSWEAGTVHGQKVDTSVLYSFTIENGVIKL